MISKGYKFTKLSEDTLCLFFLTIRLITGKTCSFNDNGKLSDKATVAENFCDLEVIFRSRPTSLEGCDFGLKYCSTVIP